MIESIEDATIKDLVRNGLSLKYQGINNIIFTKPDTLAIIDQLSKLNIPILGGDVYKRSGKQFNLTYDNWYCDKEEEETFNEYVLRSILNAKVYVENYNCLDGATYFALIPKSQDA